MKQIKHNKEELFEMMEQLAHEELSPDSIRDLDTLYGAYKALCLVSGAEHHEHHEHHEDHEHAEGHAALGGTHQRVPQTA